MGEQIENDAKHTNIPDGETVIVGFRWRLKANGYRLWNYVFGREPDSWELRESEIENVTITRK